MDSSLDKLVIIHHAELSTVLSTRVFSDVITQLLDCSKAVHPSLHTLPLNM